MRHWLYIAPLVLFSFVSCQREELTDSETTLEGTWYLWNLQHNSYFFGEVVSGDTVENGAGSIVEITFEQGGYYEHNDDTGILNPIEEMHLFIGLDSWGGGSWEMKEKETFIQFDEGVNELADFPADLWKITKLTEDELILDKQQEGEIFVPAPFNVFAPGEVISHMELRKLSD